MRYVLFTILTATVLFAACKKDKSKYDYLLSTPVDVINVKTFDTLTLPIEIIAPSNGSEQVTISLSNLPENCMATLSQTVGSGSYKSSLRLNILNTSAGDHELTVSANTPNGANPITKVVKLNVTPSLEADLCYRMSRQVKRSSLVTTEVSTGKTYNRPTDFDYFDGKRVLVNQLLVDGDNGRYSGSDPYHSHSAAQFQVDFEEGKLMMYRKMVSNLSDTNKYEVTGNGMINFMTGDFELTYTSTFLTDGSSKVYKMTGNTTLYAP